MPNQNPLPVWGEGRVRVLGSPVALDLPPEERREVVLRVEDVRPQVADLRDALVRNGPSAFVFARDAVIHDEGGGPFLRYVTSWSSELRVTPSMAEDPVWVQPDGITAVVSIGRADQVAQAAREILAAIGPTVQVAVFPLRRLDGHWGMIVRSTIGTKGMALKFLDQSRCADSGQLIGKFEDVACIRQRVDIEFQSMNSN